MRLSSLRLLRLTPFIALAGCASAGTPDLNAGASSSTSRVNSAAGVSSIEQGQTTETVDVVINAPAGKVWAVLPSIYETLSIPIEAVDTRSMALGNSQARLRQALGGSPLASYFGCGMNAFGMPNANAYTLTANIISQVVAVDATHATLRTRISAKAEQSGMSEHPASCSSTGDLELRIARMAREKLGST